MLIHINGMPGAGKLTIAKILSHQMGAALIDNHSIIDKLPPTLSKGSKEYNAAIMEAVDRSLAELSAQPRGRVILLTNALTAELAGDRARHDQIAGFAASHGRPFLQIVLSCELDENKRRLLSKDRQKKGKLVDPKALENLHAKYTLYSPVTEHTMSLDTTGLSADEAAERILRRARRLVAVS